jgi:hypothetical protein
VTPSVHLPGQRVRADFLRALRPGVTDDEEVGASTAFNAKANAL